MKEHNATRLTQEIIALSNSNTWESAKNEWQLSEIYEEEEPSTCLCGHYPIIEICVLRNRFNGNETIVGNVCVKKFLGLPSDRIFAAIKRISKDNSKSLNKEAIEYMNERGWLTDWEYGFCCNTMKKRVLSEKQMNSRVGINQKLLRQSKNQLSYRGKSG
jgi:hypothetical protein